MGTDADILVSVKGLIPTDTGCGVFLSNGDKAIAIFVDRSVAVAITMFLHQVKTPRPLTHDLIANILTGLGVTVQKMVVNDLKDDTFYARIFLVQENDLGTNYVEIDARPSDSIALALQQRCPVYVSQKVWDSSDDMTWALEQAAEAERDNKDNDETRS